MYSEKVEPKTGKLSNAVIILLAVAGILVFEPAAVWLNTIVPTVMLIMQSLFIIAEIAFCIWFYRKRLCSVRYTFITQDTERFGELYEKHESLNTLEENTLLVESIVGGGNGTYIAVIPNKSMKAYFRKGEKIDIPPRSISIRACLCDKKNASSILYEEEGRHYLIYIEPGEKLDAALAECIKK